MEDRLEEANFHYSKKVADLKKQLKSLRSDQDHQLRQVSQLQTEWSTKLEQQLKETDFKHEKEMKMLQDQLHEKLEDKVCSLEAEHKGELEALRLNFEERLNYQKVEMSSTESLMSKRMKDREEVVQEQFVKQEELLKDQISSLTKDLRATKDKLVLSEQKVIMLLSQFEQDKADSSSTRLMEAGHEVEGLKVKLRQLQNEFDISQQLYADHSKEMDKMAGRFILHVLYVCNALLL